MQVFLMDMATFIKMFVEIAGNEIFLLFLFIAFVIILFKVFRLATEIIAVAVISALFPVFLTSILKIHMALTPNTFLFFIVLGVGLLLLYKAIGIIAAPFKLLKALFSSKLGIVAVLLIGAAIVWLFYFHAPAETQFAFGVNVSRNCSSAFECSFATPVCCPDCNIGLAVNRLTFDMINSARIKNCDFMKCQAGECMTPDIGSGGILPANPVLECTNSTCSASMDCEKLCYYKASGETQYINATASLLYAETTELESKCGC